MSSVIGVKEFARIIGADHADVSRAIRDGIIPAVQRGDSFGPGNTSLSKTLADSIGAAVRCGISWRDAARMGPRLTVSRNGVFVRAA